MNPLRIAHIVNPVPINQVTSLAIAQPITLESMLIAKNFVQEQVNVELFYTKFSEENILVPEGFIAAPDLTRSVLDVKKFYLQRQLPLLQDILERISSSTNAEYLIYSNIDIGLMPHFYKTVSNFIELGYQAFTINRRTIPPKYQHIHELPLMYSEIGEPHRGWDCFVFHRSLYPKFVLGNICIGAPLVGLAMISNLIAFSDNFHQLINLHLTFHLGNERSWHGKSRSEYEIHNHHETIQIQRKLESMIGGFDPNSPPGKYLRYHNNKLIAFIYDNFLMRFYIPARFTRSS